MLEENQNIKTKKYDEKTSASYQQLFFTGVAAVVVIIGCATWALKSDNMARKTDTGKDISDRQKSGCSKDIGC